MFIYSIVGFSLLHVRAVLTKPLLINDESTPSLSVSNLVGAAFASNRSTGKPATDPSENYLIRCDGSLYGFNPNIADCEGAAHSIIPDSEQLIWRERHTGLPEDYFPLPFAVFGGR